MENLEEDLDNGAIKEEDEEDEGPEEGGSLKKVADESPMRGSAAPDSPERTRQEEERQRQEEEKKRAAEEKQRLAEE
jgi:hypothetical protein